jgi:hypothetical protein
MMDDKNNEGEATYQQLKLSQPRSHQKFRLVRSSLFPRVWGTVVADTDTITVEEIQSVAMSKERSIFFSFDLVRCLW